MKYLVTYKLDFGHGDETVSELMYVHEIAQLYGFCDCTDVHDIRVFRISDDGAPIEVELTPDHQNRIVNLVDRETGEVLEDWDWAEH